MPKKILGKAALRQNPSAAQDEEQHTPSKSDEQDVSQGDVTLQ
jgi:hypothetical protein